MTRSTNRPARWLAALASATLPALWGLQSPAADAPAQPAAAQPTTAPAPSHALFKRIQLTDQFYSEGAAFGDFNKDGHTDVVSGPYWYEGPDFSKKHEIYPVKAYDPHGYSDNFVAFAYDFNGDGYADVLVIGFPGKEAIWYENPGKSAGGSPADASTGTGKEESWKKHVIFKTVDNESPMFVDIDGDGRPDLLCMSDGQVGYATFDPADATKPWAWHPVCAKRKDYQRFTHGIGYGDVNGDGKTDILTADGWYEHPATADGANGGGANQGEWKYHAFKFGGLKTPEGPKPHASGGSQMFVYDVDGDGKNDVITSLDAHGYGLAWWQNKGPDAKGEIQFEQHLIVGALAHENPYGAHFSQLHAVDLVDLDGDGLKDLVTGKRWWAHGPAGDAEPAAPPVLYWLRLVRGPKGAEFVPYELDDNSGVGTQVMAGGTDADHKLPNIVVGNKRGTFVFINQIDQLGKESLEKLKPAKIEPMAAKGEK